MDMLVLNFAYFMTAWWIYRLIKEFDREIKDEESKNPPEVNKQLNDEKQSMVSVFRTWNAYKLTLGSPISSDIVLCFWIMHALSPANQLTNTRTDDKW